MKPHFRPGDQVITRAGQVGVVEREMLRMVSGKWEYVVNLGPVNDVVWEENLWHVNSTVARQRAYARKGRVIPSPHGAPEDDPHTDSQP